MISPIGVSLTSTRVTFVAVVGRVIVGVDAGPLAADVVVGREQLRHRRVAHRLANLGADELGRRVVGLRSREEIGERAQEADAAGAPALFVDGVALLRPHVEHAALADREIDARAVLPRPRPQARVIRLDRLLHLRVQRCVEGGNAVVRCALEDEEMLRLLGDERDALDGRGAGADDAHPPPRKVDLLFGPVSGVVGRAGE